MNRADRPVVILTGASKGLGRATARRLHLQGSLLVLPVRSAASARALDEEFGETAAVLEADVTEVHVAATTVRTANEKWGRIDGLVNNAGTIDPIGPLSNLDAAGFELAMGTNVIAPFRFMREFLAAVPRAGRCRIVNISSGAASQPMEGWSAYCASKAALAMLTRIAHIESGSHVAAFNFLPGLIDTDMQATIRGSGINRVSQLPRSSLRPADEPAIAIAYLLSGAGDDLAGCDVDIREPAFRMRAGLPSL